MSSFIALCIALRGTAIRSDVPKSFKRRVVQLWLARVIAVRSRSTKTVEYWLSQ